MAGLNTSATSFIGREEELRLLGDALSADDVSGRLVRVSGEAGVGKSRLVAEAARRVGRRVLVGYASPGSLGRPFDLLLSAVEPLVHSWSEVPAALSGIRSAVIHLLHGIAPGLDEDTSGTASPADVALAAVALVRHLDPGAMILEDLHWADVETIQVVERLLAGPEHPVVVVTYRSEDIGECRPVADLIGTMAGRGGIHVHLDPFDDVEVEQLIAAHLGRAPSTVVVDRLRARTGGNAFFLEEVLAASDSWEDPSGPLDQLPETLTETLRLRLRGLSDPERDTLATAAILGSPFTFDLLASALDLGEDELIERLRTLIDRRLIVEPEIDVFRFRHELVRESATASLLGRERRRLHDRAWHANVNHRPEAYAELARHAAGSGRLDELTLLAPKGVRHYLERGSTRQALLLAELALEHQPDDVELRELAARAAWLTGQGDAAAEHAQRWRASTRCSDDGLGIDALALLARIAYEQDDYDTEAEIVAEMEALLADVTTPTDRARLFTHLAQHHMLLGQTNGEFERSLECAAEAQCLAEEHGMHALLHQIAVEQASARASANELNEAALDDLDRVAKEAEIAGEYVTAARALHNLSLSQPADLADRTLDRMGEVAGRGGFDLATAVLLPVRKADVAVRRADLHATQYWIDRARPYIKHLKSSRHLRFHEALIRQETGAPVDDELLAGLPSDKGWPWAILLRRAAQNGDLDEVSRLLEDPPVDDSSAAMAISAALPDLAAAGVGTAEFESLRAILNDAASIQERSDIADALLAERVGAPEAVDLLAAVDGSELTTDQRSKPELDILIAAEVLLARSRLAARAGRHDDGRSFARLAADQLSRWPGRRRDEALALATEEVCSKELTGREIDVARLVARGMTNGQIADELFIARKTASTHVSNILTKLGMKSRTEIATWAVRSGLTPTPD